MELDDSLNSTQKLKGKDDQLVFDASIIPSEDELTKSHLTSSKHQSILAFLSEWDWRAMGWITIIAFLVRLALLHHPGVVIFDEVHFGGFAQKYLTHQYFLDLHPPLARLLVTLSAWVGGFDGKFSFYEIGADYLRAGVPYVMMRAFTATLGALTVPVAFVTLRAINVSSWVTAAVSLMLLFGKKIGNLSLRI